MHKAMRLAKKRPNTSYLYFMGTWRMYSGTLLQLGSQLQFWRQYICSPVVYLSDLSHSQALAYTNTSF